MINAILEYTAILLLFTYIITYGDVMMILNIHKTKIAIFHEKRWLHLYPGTLVGVASISWILLQGLRLTILHYVITGMLGLILFNEFLGFPALFRPINNPVFVPFGELSKKVRNYMQADDMIAIASNGTFRIYPVLPLKMNHIVNDEFNGDKLLISHCALSKTSIVYSRVVNGRELEFKPTTSTNQSNLIIKDNEGNFWQQISGEGLGPKNKSEQLEVVPSWIITGTRIPQLVKEGYNVEIMNYSHKGRKQMAAAPFNALMRRVDNFDKKVLFPVSFWDKRLSGKTNIMGFHFNTKSYAIPYTETSLVNEEIELDGQSFHLYIDKAHGEYTITDLSTGNRLNCVFPVYWFAWSARYQNTEIIDLEEFNTKKLQESAIRLSNTILSIPQLKH